MIDLTLQPNTQLLLWLAITYFGFDGIANIILGLMHYKKSEYYDSGHVIVGIIILIIIIIVIVT